MSTPFKAPLVAAVLLSIAISGAVYLRFTSLFFLYEHPDEVIATAVAQQVLTSGSLDTNWKLAQLPPHFQYPQYNFSGYILSCAGIIKAARIFFTNPHLSTLFILRAYSFLLGTLTILFIFLLGKQLCNATVGAFSAIIFSTVPTLYQDSLYARPEVFTTFLTVCYVYILTSKKLNLRAVFFLSSLVLGVLIATKFSLILISPMFLLPLFAPSRTTPAFFNLSLTQKTLRTLLSILLFILSGVMLGFFLGAPYALLNFTDYLAGAKHLLNQYTSGHWPHGLSDGSALDCFMYSFDYFTSTIGWIFCALLPIGSYYAYKLKNFSILYIFMVALMNFVYLSSYNVFFERNLSHLMPFFVLLASYGIYSLSEIPKNYFWKTIVAIPVLIIVILPGLDIIAKIRFIELPEIQSSKIQAMAYSLESKYDTKIIPIGWPIKSSSIESKLHPSGKSLIGFSYSGDKYAFNTLEEFKLKTGFQEVGRVESLFSNIPPCTLHTYFSPTVIFLYGNKQ